MSNIDRLLTQILFIRCSDARAGCDEGKMIAGATSESPSLSPAVYLVIHSRVFHQYFPLTPPNPPALFRSFFLIVFFCLLNMIMAVIMGAYDEAPARSPSIGIAIPVFITEPT
jgi:hypothetical protein